MDINDLSPEELRILEQFDAEEEALDALIAGLSDDTTHQTLDEPSAHQWWDFEFPAASPLCSYDRPRRAARNCNRIGPA